MSSNSYLMRITQFSDHSISNIGACTSNRVCLYNSRDANIPSFLLYHSLFGKAHSIFFLLHLFNTRNFFHFLNLPILWQAPVLQIVWHLFLWVAAEQNDKATIIEVHVIVSSRHSIIKSLVIDSVTQGVLKNLEIVIAQKSKRLVILCNSLKNRRTVAGLKKTMRR